MAESEYPHGIFCWNELMTRDVAAAARFYSELIGWKVVDSGMPGMDYKLLRVDEKNVAGLMEMPKDIPEQVPAHWMGYVAVSDIDDVLKRTPELGGKVLHGPQEVPGVGRFAVIQDPTGAVVSLLQ